MNCAIDLHDNTQETTNQPWFNPDFCEDLFLISFRGDLRMARWIYQRPVDCCHPTELVVAKRLARLGDEWVIRWGFYYETDREGDFIVLGPTGGVLVLEVKGGDLRKLSTSWALGGLVPRSSSRATLGRVARRDRRASRISKWQVTCHLSRRHFVSPT